MRVPVRLDGTSVIGNGTVGSIDFPVPGLIRSLPSAEGSGTFPPGGLNLSSSPDRRLFERDIILSKGAAELRVRIDASPGATTLEEGGASPAGDFVWCVTWPLKEESKLKLKAASPDLVVWANAAAAYKSPETFVRALIDVRRALGPSTVLWAPKVAVPSNLAILHYMGVDLLDTTAGLIRAGKGEWLFSGIDVPAGEHPDWSPCGCLSCLGQDPACIGTPGTPSELPLKDLVAHAEWQYAEEERLVRFHIGRQRLRELVEARTVSQPPLGVLLRAFDSVGFEYSENHMRVNSTTSTPYGIEESYRRPEMEWYRRWFCEGYVAPASKKVLALVPCSYTKPYSNSPTHRAFARSLSLAKTPGAIHIVSVTSPMGVVPKELEWTYPARNYDIPVTGNWTSEERKWVIEGVRKLTGSARYEFVVVHLSQRECGWLTDELPPSDTCLWTAGLDSPSSKAALARLEEAAVKLPSWPAPQAKVHMDEARSQLAFQFSREIAESLTPEDARLLGPPWFLRLAGKKGEILATWKEDRGCWHLTIEGAARALDVSTDFHVAVTPEIKLTGDLFAPGVISAGKRVRLGGEAILVADGKLIGVGEAVVPGEWLGAIRKGLVVRVRKHGRNP